MKPYLIYQVAVGETRELYETCMASVANYCDQHNIEHHIQREPLLRIQPRQSHRSEGALKLGYLPIFEKENAFTFLDQYQAVLILDSDIWIRPGSPCVFDVTPQSAFQGVIERDMPLTEQHQRKIRKYSESQYGALRSQADFGWTTQGAAFFNMGMMLLRPSILPYLQGQTPSEFIHRPEFEKFVNGEGAWRWSTDQTLLNYWLRKESIPVTSMTWHWNALYGAIQSERISEAWFVHFFLAEHHVGDRSIADVIKELQN